jgi:hypothetical protein
MICAGFDSEPFGVMVYDRFSDDQANSPRSIARRPMSSFDASLRIAYETVKRAAEGAFPGSKFERAREMQTVVAAKPA